MIKSQEKKDFNLNDLLGIKMSSALLAMKRLLLRNFEQEKLTLNFEEWINLLPLLGGQELTQKEFSNILGKDKTTVSRLISLWEKKGLVQRKMNPKDGRAVLLQLTDKALRLHRSASPIVIDSDRVFRRALSEKELKVFLRLLGKIHSEVQQELYSQ